jgi:hypothetical protein
MSCDLISLEIKCFEFDLPALLVEAEGSEII